MSLVGYGSLVTCLWLDLSRRTDVPSGQGHERGAIRFFHIVRSFSNRKDRTVRSWLFIRKAMNAQS
ncbi:hypothetical protein, partial [Priestia megaterium]|uniref:hypothetical protein n=1 Tax=Priestia megaterium TaxID=1404 RepID=UPI001C556466